MSGLDKDKIKSLLNKRDKAELVDWILDQAAAHDDLHRALISFVAPQAEAGALVSELKLIIRKAWERTRTHKDPHKLASPIASDLEPVFPVLENMIENGHAVEAEKVLHRFVEAAEKGFDYVDDSIGRLGPLCQDAVTLWGKAWSKIEPRDSSKLAKMVYDGVRDNNYAIRDRMIRDFAAALGREGLLTLKDLFLAEHRANLSQKGMDKWERQEPLRHLTDVADALNDVDMYIDIQRQCDAEEIYAMPIARRLMDAGRNQEAIDYINRADPNRSFFHDEKDDYATIRFKILKALGREGEARDLLWNEFSRSLSGVSLDRILAMTPAENQQALIDQALIVAEAHTDKVASALFLVERGQKNRAARMIDAHPDCFDGRFYGSLLSLTEALQDQFPSAAWVLYRSLLLSILDEKRSKAYHHAAYYLKFAGELAQRAGIREKHQELMSLLKTRHGLKYSFWDLVHK